MPSPPQSPDSVKTSTTGSFEMLQADLKVKVIYHKYHCLGFMAGMMNPVRVQRS